MRTLKQLYMGRTGLAAAVMLLVAACGKNTVTESGYIPVSEGGQIYYESVGEGLPVILLHGHTLDMRMWDPQVQPLVDAGYRVIRPEMRGYGRSSKQRPGVQFTHMDDMLTVMDSLHIDKAHIVGLSMGGFVAGDMVAMHPERMISVTLSSGVIRNMPGPSTPFDSLETAKKDAEIAAVKAEGVEAWKKKWIEQLISGGGTDRENIRQSLTAQVEDWDGFQLLNREMRLYYAYEAWDTIKVRKPAVPALILSGEYEHKPKSSMLPYLPKASETVIPDCGHMSNMEKPKIFTDLILDLFRRAEKQQ